MHVPGRRSRRRGRTGRAGRAPSRPSSSRSAIFSSVSVPRAAQPRAPVRSIDGGAEEDQDGVGRPARAPDARPRRRSPGSRRGPSRAGLDAGRPASRSGGPKTAAHSSSSSVVDHPLEPVVVDEDVVDPLDLGGARGPRGGADRTGPVVRDRAANSSADDAPLADAGGTGDDDRACRVRPAATSRTCRAAAARCLAPRPRTRRLGADVELFHDLLRRAPCRHPGATRARWTPSSCRRCRPRRCQHVLQRELLAGLQLALELRTLLASHGGLLRGPAARCSGVRVGSAIVVLLSLDQSGRRTRGVYARPRDGSQRENRAVYLRFRGRRAHGDALSGAEQDAARDPDGIVGRR